MKENFQPRKRLYPICGFIALAVCNQSAALAVEGAELECKTVHECPVSAIVISGITNDATLGVSTNLLQLTFWPSAVVIESQTARTNRSKSIRPFGAVSGSGQQPVFVYPAVSPKFAGAMAVDWIKRVLKQGYVPNDLENRLVLLQRDPPSQSAAFCRYRIDGYSFQISQVKSAMWVMIKPDKEKGLSPSSSNDVAAILKDVFTKGAEMAAYNCVEKKRPYAKKVYVPDRLDPRNARAEEEWWGWQMWYSDGDAVGVLLPKWISQEPHHTSPTEPWF